MTSLLLFRDRARTLKSEAAPPCHDETEETVSRELSPSSRELSPPSSSRRREEASRLPGDADPSVRSPP